MPNILKEAIEILTYQKAGYLMNPDVLKKRFNIRYFQIY